MNKIIYSALRTPDGTVLVSQDKYDLVTYWDENGKQYMLDGGTEYIRSSAHGDEEFITVTLDDEHTVVREHVFWGTYGKDGKGPYRKIKLSEMSNDHIRAVLETQKGINPAYREAMLNEMTYRDANQIFIED